MKKYDFNFIDIVENAADVIIVTKAMPIDEPGPEIVYVNKAFTELTGYTSDEVLGKNPRILQSGGTDTGARKDIRNALIEQKPIRTTLKNYTKNGDEYWLDISILPLKNDRGKITHFVAIERDVSDQKLLENTLKELTRTDSLTGVFNRRAFDEILNNEYSRFKRSGAKYSLIMLDIDHFKKVNDTYGHSAGDEALKEVARTCKVSIRRHDSLSRVGGEEFCILLPYTNKKIAGGIAEKLRNHIMEKTISFENSTISITVSMGVAEVSESDKDCFDAFKRADSRLYEAKKTGRNRVIV